MSNLKDLAHNTFPPEALTPAADRQRDVEMQEVITKFEEIFADLESDIEDEPVPDECPDSDFDDIASVMTHPRDIATTVQPRDKREPELAAKPRVEAKAGATAISQKNAELDIDEALSILRKAEGTGKAAGARDSQDVDDEAQTPLAIASSPVRSRSITEPMMAPKFSEPAIGPKGAEPAPVAAAPEWSAKSRTLWTVALIAASVALVMGTGMGYLMGRGHEAKPSVAKIQPSQHGGARLRADYELRKR